MPSKWINYLMPKTSIAVEIYVKEKEQQFDILTHPAGSHEGFGFIDSIYAVDARRGLTGGCEDGARRDLRIHFITRRGTTRGPQLLTPGSHRGPKRAGAARAPRLPDVGRRCAWPAATDARRPPWPDESGRRRAPRLPDTGGRRVWPTATNAGQPPRPDASGRRRALRLPDAGGRRVSPATPQLGRAPSVPPASASRSGCWPCERGALGFRKMGKNRRWVWGRKHG